MCQVVYKKMAEHREMIYGLVLDEFRLMGEWDI